MLGLYFSKLFYKHNNPLRSLCWWANICTPQSTEALWTSLLSLLQACLCWLLNIPNCIFLTQQFVLKIAPKTISSSVLQSITQSF